MANNQPTIEPDKELEALKGKVPGLEDEPEAPAPIVEVKPEPEKPAPAPDKKPDPAPEQDPADEKEPPTRPEKYIPIKQYTSEKRIWNETVSEYKTRIAELEEITKGNGSDKTDAIESYAEKYGADAEQIKELKLALGINDVKPEPKVEPKTSPEDQAILDRSREIVAEKMFQEEYTKLAIPELKAAFPNATPEQLEKARTEVEKLATTKEYLDKSLDFVVYKNKSAFDAIFAPDRKGPESARQAPEKGNPTYTASDFAGGKTPFSAIAELPVEKQTEIVEAMDLKTYEKYMNWVSQNDNLAISRGGRKL